MEKVVEEAVSELQRGEINSDEVITKPQEGNQIDISVLVEVKKLLDAAIARGAYKPEELEYVGGVYNKFVGAIPKETKG